MKVDLTNNDPMKNIGIVEIVDVGKTADNINELVSICFGNAKSAGWHKEVAPDVENYLKATQLMLMVSEIAEAMEGTRKSLMDDHLKHRPMVEVELADAIIRICDFSGRW